MAPVNPVELIARKRDAKQLQPREIRYLVDGFVRGRVADYQMSAWLMAAWLNGLDESETTALTEAMLHSGKVLRLRSVRATKVDKHSTGGVGDKISLCLAPLVAACGVAVPMISGRGLGHTGGTLDKLESIPGYQTRLDAKQFERVVRDVGASIVGQSAELAPADRRIYSLRDVTATVESIPLIVASILSKKLAAGLDGLVLDVKCGGAAFMRDLESARALAQALVRIGRRAGLRTVALITDMNAPIGSTIGNALETAEAIGVLRGEDRGITRELTLSLGEEMLKLAAGVRLRSSEARRQLEKALDSGKALERFARMVRQHGGDPRVVEDVRRLPRAPQRVVVEARRGGFVQRVDARELALVALALGAGRTRVEQAIDPRVGVELLKAPMAEVAVGEPMAFLHARTTASAKQHIERARAAFHLGRTRAQATPLIIERVTK